MLVDGEFASSNCLKGHDWAIVEVEKRIHFSENVRPICLPRPNMYYTKSLAVPGWGRSYRKFIFLISSLKKNKSIYFSVFNESGPLIHEIPMRIDRDCKRPWSDRLPADADDFICATSMNVSNYSAPRTCHVR